MQAQQCYQRRHGLLRLAALLTHARMEAKVMAEVKKTKVFCQAGQF